MSHGEDTRVPVPEPHATTRLSALCPGAISTDGECPDTPEALVAIWHENFENAFSDRGDA